MWLDVFDRNAYGTNCWMLAADGSDEAVVIDPGFEPDLVRAMLAEGGKSPAAVLLTHTHVDHAAAAGDFAGDEVPVYAHPADALAFEDPEAWGAGFPGALRPVKDLRTFVDGDVLAMGGLEIRVAHTPGHTPGHCCFDVSAAQAVMLSGDLVFAGSIGRSDFANSSPPDMERSLRWFLSQRDEVEVLPGHGRRTTVARERASNPFLGALA